MVDDGRDVKLAQSYADILTCELPPARPVIEGLIDEQAAVIIAGPPGVGKTWLEISMAIAVATGQTWICHHRTKKGPVLIIDEESHIRGLQSRLRQMQNANPIDLEAPIYFAVSTGIRIDSPEGFTAAKLLIETYQPVVTFVDSLTRVHGADENSAGQMSDVFYSAKQLMQINGTALVFLDHVRKRSLLNDPAEMLRGSTEKMAWPDTVLFLAPADRNIIQVSHIKSRFSEKVDDFRVKINVDPEAETAEVVHDGAAPAKETTKANDIIRVIHEIQQSNKDGSTVKAIAAMLDCSESTADRYAKKLAAAEILIARIVPSGEQGGRPKTVYDVKGGRD